VQTEAVRRISLPAASPSGAGGDRLPRRARRRRRQSEAYRVCVGQTGAVGDQCEAGGRNDWPRLRRDDEWRVGRGAAVRACELVGRGEDLKRSGDIQQLHAREGEDFDAIDLAAGAGEVCEKRG